MRKLKKKRVDIQAPKTSGTPVEIYNSPEDQFGLPVTPSVAPLINTGYSDYDLDPFYDNPRIQELRAANDAILQQANQDYNEYAWDKKIEEYYDKFTQSKKTDKISPLETLPLDNLTPELEEELKAQGFFINKTKTEAQLFPEDIIQKRVIDNGFRENQFSNYWGLNAKQVKQQYGDLFKAADQQYEATVLNKVLTESVKQGKSPDQIFNTLPKSWGVTSELKKKYLNKSQEELQKVIKQVNTQLEETAVGKNWNWLFEGKDPEGTFNSTYYTKADGSPDWDKINARDKKIEEAKNKAEKIFQPELDINKRTPGKDSDQFSNFNPLDNDLLKAQRRGLVNAAGEQAASEPFNQAQQEYTSQLAQEAALSLIQSKLSQAKLDNNFDEQARILGALQSNKISDILSDQEISDAVNNNLFWKNQQGTITASDPLRQDLNWLDKTQDALTYFPDFLKQGTGMWDGESLSYRDRKEIEKSTGMDMGTDKDNLVGDALNTFNPFRLGYESRKNVEAGRYGDLALDAASTFSPFYAGKLASGIAKGAGKVLKYSPVKSMPWLNLQNAVVDPYFAYESVKPGGLFNEAYTDFSKGDIGSGIANTAFGAMGVLPYVQPAKELATAYKTLSTPGGKVAIPTAGKYAFGYQSPQASELFVGNPAIEGAIPAFESFTNPLNRFTRAANLGEFKVMKNSPVAKSYGFSSTEYNPRFIGATEDIVENAATNGLPKTLDTEVPLYRVEPERINYRTGAPSSTGKLGAADDIIEVEQLDDKIYNSTDDETVVQLADDLRTRKMERWQSPEGQRRLQQMIDNTPSLQGLTPNDYVETLGKANVWNRQRNDATVELAAANQELQKLKEEHGYIYGDIYESGSTPSKDIVDELTNKEELVKTKINDLENTLSSLEAKFPESLGYWEPRTQTVAIDPSKITAEDAKIILAHELAGHTLGSPKDKIGTTYLDDALSNLELINEDEITKRTLNNISPQGQLSILNQPSGAYESYGPGGYDDDYIPKAIEYWNTGSEGTEKVPFATEVVEDMLTKGLIKSEYDKVTPDLLRKHFDDYMNTRGNKYPLRIYDIMEGKKKNFKILSDVINNLPAIGGAALAADAIMGDDENKDENVANAGLLMLFGRFGKSGRATQSLLSKLQRGEKLKKTPVIGAAYKFLRSGYDKLSKNEIKLLDQIIDIERVKVEEKLAGNLPSAFGSGAVGDYYASNLSSKARTKLERDFKAGTLDPIVRDTYIRLGKAHLEWNKENGLFVPSTMTDKDFFMEGISRGGKHFNHDNSGSIAMLKEKIIEIEGQRMDLIRKINSFVDKSNPEYTKAQARLWELNIKSANYKSQVGDYELQGEKIVDSANREAPWLKQSIKSGSGYIMDLATNKLVPVTNKLPQTSMIYTLTDRTTEGGEEISKSMERIAGGLDPVAEQTVTNNINLTVNALPGAKPYGSSVLVSGLQIPHLANDVDVMMTDADLAKISGNIEYLGKKSPTSPAHRYNVFPNAGDAGVIDVNLIMTGPDGLAMDDPASNVKHATKTFRQFFPIEFAAEAKAAALEGRPIKIPYTPEQLMERFDPLEKSVMDAYESDPELNNAAEKQRYRPDVIVSFTAEDKLDKVASGQLKYIKSLVGENGNLGRQFPEEAFSDVGENLQMLNEMNYPGARSVIAKSPKRMQLALNDYYINKTTFVREIDPDRIKNAATKEEGILSAFQDWDPRHGGGSARGIGLNSQELGKIGHVSTSSYPILGNRQLNVIGNGKHADYTLDLNDPRSYIEQIKYEMGEGIFTPAEREQLNKIYNETIGKVRGEEISVEDTWMFPNELIDDPVTHYAKRPVYLRGNEADAGIEFLNRLNSELGLRAIKSAKTYRSGIYASTISKIDDTIDGIMYGAIDSMPTAKSWAQRTELTSAITNNQIHKAKRQLPIDTVRNFKKVKNLLQSGIRDIDKERDELVALTNKLEKDQDLKSGKYISKSKKYRSLLDETNSVQDVINKFNEHIQNLTNQQDLLQRRIDDIEGFKDSLAVFFVITAALGTSGAFIKSLYDTRKEREARNQKTNKEYFDKNLPEMIEKGEGEEFLQDYLEAMGPNRRSWRQHKNDKGWDKKKFGGSTGIDLEITQEEIDDLINQGYKVVQR